MFWISCDIFYPPIPIWAVGIAQPVGTGWRVRGSIPGGGVIFPCVSRAAPRSTRSPLQWVTGSIQRVKQPERGVNHQPTPHCNAKITKALEL
jgi:hypothetical protein